MKPGLLSLVVLLSSVLVACGGGSSGPLSNPFSGQSSTTGNSFSSAQVDTSSVVAQVSSSSLTVSQSSASLAPSSQAVVIALSSSSQSLASSSAPASLSNSAPVSGSLSSPSVPSSASASSVSFSATSNFIHPGLLHSEADFERIRSKLQAQEEPWVSNWNLFVTDGWSQLGQKPAPLEILIRGGDGQNFGRVITQIRSAYALALRWKISGDEAYAKLAVDYLNAWSSTLTAITGNADRFLAAGLYGYEFANIGEIMRTYPGWVVEDQTRFKGMLVDIFYPLNHSFLVNHNGACISNYWANWDLANIAGMLAIGVFADRDDIYQEALHYLYNGEGNGALDNMVYYLHAGNMGQFQESGRDQGHTTLGVALFGTIAKMAWNQNVDVFAYDNYRLLAAAEYIARYNVFEDVPYVPYGPNCKSAGLQSVIADYPRGHKRNAWELIYNHYQNRLGIAAPWTEKMVMLTRPEKSGGGDELGWGSLTEAADPAPDGGAPRGLTTQISGHTVVLSWWGAAGAESYFVKRATSATGPFAVIATHTGNQDLTFTDTDVSAGQDYFYQVSAVSSMGESAASNTVIAEVGPRLKVHLDFNSVEAGAIKNSVDGKLVGQLHNGAGAGEGLHGQALMLDGVDDYVSLSEGLVATLADFTIAFWVNLDEARTWARVFDFGDSNQRYMALAANSANNQSQFMITRISSHAEQKLNTTAVPAGRWVHVAVTLDGKVGKLYIDGVPAASGEFTLAPFRLGVTRQNWLGRSQYESDPYLKGRVDDFRIYSGVLSAEAIAQLLQ